MYNCAYTSDSETPSQNGDTGLHYVSTGHRVAAPTGHHGAHAYADRGWYPHTAIRLPYLSSKRTSAGSSIGYVSTKQRTSYASTGQRIAGA
eukprot:3940746-Rhodomonas_salina.1